MTTLDAKVAGDVGDTFIVILQDDGVAIDLTTATGVEAHVWQSGGTPVDLTAAVTTAAEGKITVALGTIVGNPRTVTDGATTISDATVTSATANFVAGDVGMTIAGTGIPAGTTIASVTNGTTVELSAVATASGTAVTLTITGGWLPTVATPGKWLIEYEVTFSAANVKTWPSGRPDDFIVRAQGS